MAARLTSPLCPAVTKLQVSKSKRTLTLVENRPIQLNCSVKSQTSQNSHFAVLWYVHKPSDADGKLILKTTHTSAFEYGTYAEEEGLRPRLQFERHASGGLFSLTVQRAEVSDSGSYYCHVEEWLLSPNFAWYKLAEEVSGRTEVTVKQPGEQRGCSHPGQWVLCGEACTGPWVQTHTPSSWRTAGRPLCLQGVPAPMATSASWAALLWAHPHQGEARRAAVVGRRRPAGFWQLPAVSGSAARTMDCGLGQLAPQGPCPEGVFLALSPAAFTSAPAQGERFLLLNLWGQPDRGPLTSANASRERALTARPLRPQAHFRASVIFTASLLHFDARIFTVALQLPTGSSTGACCAGEAPGLDPQA